MNWPNGKAFAFTIFDDTDNATVANTKPIYDLLYTLGFRTTKSVWIYPPRGRFTGQSLSDPDYLAWVQNLQVKGFEIGLHNVGDGLFTRGEILAGLDLFRDLLGSYPRIHTNHESNPDSIYWFEERFDGLVRYLYRAYRRLQGQNSRSQGHVEGSPFFWGDACKQHIDYIRNHTFPEINTLKIDPSMPYVHPKKRSYSNRWFSSSDGPTAKEFCDILSKKNVDRLVREGGACIIYTHFASGFVDSEGEVESMVIDRLTYLASLAGWFTPVSGVLDHLASCQERDARVGLGPSDCKWFAAKLWKILNYNH